MIWHHQLTPMVSFARAPVLCWPVRAAPAIHPKVRRDAAGARAPLLNSCRRGVLAVLAGCYEPNPELQRLLGRLQCRWEVDACPAVAKQGVLRLFGLQVSLLLLSVDACSGLAPRHAQICSTAICRMDGWGFPRGQSAHNTRHGNATKARRLITSSSTDARCREDVSTSVS